MFLYSTTLQSAIVDLDTATLTLVDNGDGTKTLTYTFRVFQPIPATATRTINLDIRFIEDDPICDDRIGTRTSPDITMPIGENYSNYVSVSITFNPSDYEEDNIIEYHAAVLGKHGVAGTGDGFFHFPATSGSGDPPPGQEPELCCRPNIIGSEGLIANVSVLSDALIIDPYNFPILPNLESGFHFYEVFICDFNGNSCLSLGYLETDGFIENIENIEIDGIDNTLLGFPTMTIFNESSDVINNYDNVLIYGADENGNLSPSPVLDTSLLCVENIPTLSQWSLILLTLLLLIISVIGIRSKSNEAQPSYNKR